MPVGERTEPASPRRRSEARAKGQVARSTQLTSAVVLLAGLLYLKWTGPALFGQARALFVESFTQMGRSDLVVADLWPLAGRLGIWVATFAGPPLALLVAVGLIASAAQVGLRVSFKPIAPDVDRLNALHGFGRLFSQRAAVDSLRTLFEVAVVVYVVYATLRGRLDDLATLLVLDLRDGVESTAAIVLDSALNATAALLVLSALDYAWQRYSHTRSLRMTKQEVKDEAKQIENPTVRSRVRARQREIAGRRGPADGATASLVVAIPDQIAVALRYDPEAMPVPRVIARGQRQSAEGIQRTAREHGTPVFEDPALARALFAATSVGAEVPPHLYAAVAEALAISYEKTPKSALARQAAAARTLSAPLNPPAVRSAEASNSTLAPVR